MFHIYVKNVCFKCFIHFIRILHSSVSCCMCFMLFGESKESGEWWYMAPASENGPRWAGGQGMGRATRRQPADKVRLAGGRGASGRGARAGWRERPWIQTAKACYTGKASCLDAWALRRDGYVCEAGIKISTRRHVTRAFHPDIHTLAYPMTNHSSTATRRSIQTSSNF
jgi:hypothetical protein